MKRPKKIIQFLPIPQKTQNVWTFQFAVHDPSQDGSIREARKDGISMTDYDHVAGPKGPQRSSAIAWRSLALLQPSTVYLYRTDNPTAISPINRPIY